MCKVVKMKWPHIAPAGAVKVDRKGGNKWGNPFDWRGTPGTIPVKDRAEAIAKYEQYLFTSPHLLKALPELTGKDLACWCAPEPCHAEVLIKYANDEKFLHTITEQQTS